MRTILKGLALVAWILAGPAVAEIEGSARYSDPHSPAELRPQPLGSRVHGFGALGKLERRLQEELGRFPPIESRAAPPQQRFGYLSERHPLSPDMDAWVQLAFPEAWRVKTEGIALIPAYYPEFSAEGNYGFPKRFKIEVFTAADPETAIRIVDWTAADFPDPGLHPVYFSLPDLQLQRVLLTVTRGAQDGVFQFFALDELMIFRAGSDVVPPAYQNLTASSSFEAPPYWQLMYLANRKVHVGNFLHTDHPAPDFIQYFDAQPDPKNPPRIEIDLGGDHNIGRVELYPAKAPGQPIPEFAFPLQCRIDLLKKLKPETLVQSQLVGAADPSSPGMRWHPFFSAKGRYLRLTFLDLPRQKGLPVLALGEIRAIGDQGVRQTNYAAGKNIRTENFPAAEAADTALLVDEVSNGRRIIPEREYIEQLAARKIVAQSLAQVQQRLLIARATRTTYFWMAGIIAAIALVFSLVFWVAYQRIARERALLNLRQQIAADLHDDISSNLGTITMIAKRLQQDASPSLIKKKLMEISHIAQESFISVKEIIWHMDSDVVHFAEVFGKIEKTAHSILSDSTVTCRFPEQVQDAAVPAQTRRNIMLLVKEALYNCAKYAKAKNMLIHADMRDSFLVLSMEDDGCGFDPTCAAAADSDSGRGLINMERRARLLGAELAIHSEPGGGTKITLRMPIK